MYVDFFTGSGHFVERHDPANLGSVTFNEQTRQVVVNPLLDGNLRVQVLDLCLVAESHADAIIHIAGAHSVQLQIRDKVPFVLKYPA